MSRLKIGAVVALVIAALTAGLYIVTANSLESRIEADVEERVVKAQQLLLQNSSLEALGLMKRAEVLARDAILQEALQAEESAARYNLAQKVFQRHMAELKTDEPKPDFVALVDADGNVSAMLDVPRPNPEEWKERFPAVDAALSRGIVSKDVWDYRGSVMEVGVAPIYDPDTAEPMGALILAYALNSREAQNMANLLGVQVAYVFGGRIHATSFRRGGAEEDTERRDDLSSAAQAEGMLTGVADGSATGKLAQIELAGQRYLSTAARFPLNFDDKTAGAIVLMSLSEAKAPLDSVRNGFLVLGLGSILVALLGIGLTSRSILGPAEEIELGVTEIINGDIDYTFKPVGRDLDGLANALNVMLARLLGRPEPGEEEYDEFGNIVGHGGKLSFDEGQLPVPGGKIATDAETLGLAQESEPDYYKRLFQEYVEARRSVGDSVEVQFESFVAKVRLSEANLKKKYNSRAVRFRVQTKDNQVSLKPVPIL